MTKTLMGCVAVVLATVAGPVDGRAQETQRLSGPAVTVYNLAGEVSVVRGSGSDVVVRITRGGADAARLDVRTGDIDGRSTLRVVYPDDTVIYPEMGRGSNSTVRVRSDGTFGGRSGGRGDEVRIRGSGRGLEAWADLTIEVPSGKDFEVRLAAGQVEVRAVQSDVSVDTGTGRVDVTDVTGNLDVDTGSGSVHVRRVRGNLNLDTGSGSVTVNDIDGDVVMVDTGSGGVRGGAIRARSVEVDTGSGSIELDEVTATEVILDTGSGSVDLMLTTDVETLDVDTGSGSVTIRAPADLGGEVDIETGSGGIDMDFAVQVRSVRRDHVQGTLGDGRGRIRIDTGSGGVRLIKN
jgi:hypothetical protein